MVDKAIPDEKSEEALEPVEEAQHKVIASLAISGLNPTAISTKTKISRFRVTKIMRSDEFKNYLAELSSDMTSTAVNTWKAAMLQRIAECMRVIDKKLQANDLDAVKLIMTTIGVNSQEKVQPPSPPISIYLPQGIDSNILNKKSTVVDSEEP